MRGKAAHFLLAAALCACTAKRKEAAENPYAHLQQGQTTQQGHGTIGSRGGGMGGGGAAYGLGGYGGYPESTELGFEDAELDAAYSYGPETYGSPGPETGSLRGQTDAYKVGKKGEKKTGESQQHAVEAAMIHYNGYAMLRVARVDEGLDRIADLAREAGGKLESRGGDRITVRVPREAFETFFPSLLELGDVMRKSITAEDVSEAFTSVDLRLKTSKATRERLLQLLEKAEDEKEKIRILQQIQRLNEEIDTMEAQLRTLRGLAEMSRITVELVPRQAATRSMQQEASGFGWINWLTPFSSTVCQEASRLDIQTPEGLVSLTRKGPYVAESADGAVLRACVVPNQPQGDSVFWQKAIQDRLADGFASAEPLSIGTFAGLRMEEDAEDPYIYLVGVRAVKDELHIVELYYPGKPHEDRYHEAIAEAVRGGAS